MLVLTCNDFFSDPARYRAMAEESGLKILPKKKKKKISRRIQKKLDALNAVVGLIPSDVDVDALLEERRLEK